MLRADRLRRAVILGFLFVSGGTGLVYQIVWSKYLANQLGNSGQAHAVVIATFMGGLALGAWVFGKRADKVKSPLAMYGVLELGTGLYALIFPFVLSALGAAYLFIAPSLPESVRVVPKLLLAASSLVIPTMLMGGTLPALARYFTRDLGGMQRELARLYAVNSLGAAFGVFLSGVRLLPNFGLKASSIGAAIVNILLAVGVLVLTRGGAKTPEVEHVESDGSSLEYPARAVRAALIGVMISGFTSMLYEVTWIRILAITQGASTYAFSLILTAFILGIGLGSFWLSTRVDRAALRLFGRLQLLLVMALCIAVPLYVRLPWLFWQARYLLHRTPDAWPLYQLFTFSFCCLVLIVPCFFMGAAFPTAARVATAKISELGTKLGGVYLWNTIGTISGAALGGLVLLPAIGMEGNILLGIVLNAVAGIYALWADGWELKSRATVAWAAALVVALGVLGSEAGWSHVFSNSGAIHSWDHPPSTFDKYKKWVMDGVELTFRKDDTFATVVVAQTPKGHRYIRMNGKTDASNGADIKTQILAGHMGSLFRGRDPENVLLIGSGAAITAGSILSHSAVKNLDLVEISPAVIEAAKLFSPDNRHAFDDPRMHVHIEDAKTFMALAPHKYDLIVSVPSNPWVAGVSGLFTREFFVKTRDHLADDGVLVQWLQTYETDEKMVALVIRTLRETFPYATTWEALPADLVLVTSKQPMSLDVDVLAKRMAEPTVAEDLARADVKDVPTLLSMQVHSPDGQVEFAGEGPINTDDLNILEYGSPIALFIDHEDLKVRDERRAPDGGQRLFFSKYLAEHPLTEEQAKNIYVQHSKHRTRIDPLVLSSAETWFRIAPNADSRAALADTLLAFDDLDGARAVMQPALDAGEHTPKLLAVQLEVKRRDATYRRTVWNPQPPDVALIQEASARVTEAPELRTALGRYCGAYPAGTCPQLPPAEAKNDLSP